MEVDCDVEDWDRTEFGLLFRKYLNKQSTISYCLLDSVP